MPPPLKTLPNPAPTPLFLSIFLSSPTDVTIGEEFLAGIHAVRRRFLAVTTWWSSPHSLSCFPLFLSLCAPSDRWPDVFPLQNLVVDKLPKHRRLRPTPAAPLSTSQEGIKDVNQVFELADPFCIASASSLPSPTTEAVTAQKNPLLDLFVILFLCIVHHQALSPCMFCQIRIFPLKIVS
jgi:hypothetical protein